jgi:putative adhesin
MSTYVRTQTIDHQVGERGRVSLNVVSGDVRLRGIPGGEAHIRATFEIKASSDSEADRILETIQLSVDRSGGSLSVEERGDRRSVGSMIGRLFGASGDYDLSVEADVPIAAQMQLTAVSSDVTVVDLRGEQRYHTVSGDLSVINSGGSVRLETVSGDAAVRADGQLSVQAQTVSGDLNIVAPLLGSLRANTVSGDVDLEAELAGTGDFKVETVSGDLSVGLVGSATFEIHGLSTDVSSELDHRLEGQVDRRRLIIGSGGPRLIFNSMSGDVDIRHPRRINVRPAAPKSVAEPTPAEQESQLEVLRALERGEIDVEEATRRLAGGS